MASGYQQNQQQYIPQQYQQYAQQAQQYQQQMQQYTQNPQQYQQYAQTSHALHGAVSSANGLLQPGRPKGAMGKKGKKAKDPNRPKRPTSAYFFFIASKREEAKMRGQHISKVAEWTKQVSALWREMKAGEKAPFEKQAVADKARYEQEMQAYSGKRPKDENKPKRPCSAYFIFLADFRAQNKHHFTGEGAHKDLIRAAGDAWNKLAPEQKEPYEKSAEKEKLKYEEAMKIYNQGGMVKQQRLDTTQVTQQQPQQQPQHQHQQQLPPQQCSSANGAGAGAAPVDDDDDDEEDDDEEDDE